MKVTENIWFEYHKKLSNFIRNRVSDSVVDDILQDVFVKIHTQIHSLRNETKLESWLYQIARNAVTDYYRSKKPIEDLPDWIKQPQPDKEEIIRRELSSCLEPLVKQLPDIYREAIQLSEIEGKTQKEVATAKNISLSGAKSRVQRGRVLLKTLFHDCCQIEINKNNQLVSYEQKEQDCKFC